MRVSTVALCTLTALATQEFHNRAQASPNPEIEGKDPLELKIFEASDLEAVGLVKPIAPPETSSLEYWNPENEASWNPEDGAAPTFQPTVAPERTLTFSSPQTTPLPTPQVELPTLGTVILAALPEFSSVNTSPEPASISPRPVTGRSPLNDHGAQPTLISQANRLPTVQTEPPPSQQDIDTIETELDEVEDAFEFDDIRRSAPALTIMVPSGFGVDNNTVFLTSTFQEDTRYSEEADGAIGVGIGLGDARRAIGAEISYTVASFGSNRDFGTGGFNVRLHRRLTDNLSASVGWRGIITTGNVDFRDSIYGSVTQIFHTRESLESPFSRVAVTAGVGNGQFRTEENVLDGDGGVGAFGSIAVRVAQPVSFITEWTGQDLAMGLSIAPFRNRNIVITPAVRDIAGGGDGARFVLGAGINF
jgi:hypothetical protein